MCRLNGEADAACNADSLASLMNKVDHISSDARVAHTESYFYELLEGNEKDRANKIQSRIAESSSPPPGWEELWRGPRGFAHAASPGRGVFDHVRR